MSNAASVIVSYYYKKKKNEDGTDTAVLVVGQKNPKMDIQIVNAFKGEEAKELWNRLTAKGDK